MPVATFSLPAYSTEDFSLTALMGALPLPLPYCSIRIQYSGPPGSLIAQAPSVDAQQDLVIDAHTMNEGDGWAGSGANPWHLDNQTESILFLTDESDKPARIGFHVVANGVTYRLTQLKLNPHETRAIDIRKLRDAQNEDFLKNQIPAGATDGSVEWNRIDNVAVTGRLVVIQKNQGAASSYDCCICNCPESYEALSVGPAGASVIPGGTAQFDAQGEYENCNKPPADYFDETGVSIWASSNTSVATMDPSHTGRADAVAGGTSDITAIYSDYRYSGSTCSGTMTQHESEGVLTVCDFVIQGAPSGTHCDGVTKNETTYQAASIPSACTVVPASSTLTFVVGGDVTADYKDSYQSFTVVPTLGAYYYAGSLGGTLTPEFTIQFTVGNVYHQKTDDVCP